MGAKTKRNTKPFVSLAVILVTLFSLVVLKMEVRRMGYAVLKQLREFKNIEDSYRYKLMEYAQYTSSERLRHVAEARLTLGEVKVNQVIQMAGKKIALRQ